MSNFVAFSRCSNFKEKKPGSCLGFGCYLKIAQPIQSISTKIRQPLLLSMTKKPQNLKPLTRLLHFIALHISIEIRAWMFKGKCLVHLPLDSLESWGRLRPSFLALVRLSLVSLRPPQKTASQSLNTVHFFEDISTVKSSEIVLFFLWLFSVLLDNFHRISNKVCHLFLDLMIFHHTLSVD